MKKITTLLTAALILAGIEAYSQNARVQVIHNSADAAATEVDVYLNGTILLDDFAFRTASPFLDAPAGVPLTLVVAPGDSTSAADGIFTVTTTLANNGKYIIIANGIVSDTGYTPNTPTQAFNLYIYDMARETATMAANTDILVFHGATDAPTVDAVEPGVGIAVNNISYGEFQGYLQLANDNYFLDITTADNSTVVESYSVPLDLLGLDGEAITVLASGFLNPANNSNGPAFGLWAALASGGDLVRLPLADEIARVQVIHNAADIAAQTVDVYVNGDILLDDFQFRTASPFIDVTAGFPLTIAVAPGNSTSVADAIYTTTTTFVTDETYIVVANGIVSTTGYTPNQAFQLYVYEFGRETSALNDNTDILVFHGATDAPTVDVDVQDGPNLVDDISYGNYDSYVEVPAVNYVIDVNSADGATTVASYNAPLQTLGLSGQAITVLASGFLDPSENNNGPGFGLWVAQASGGDLLELPTAVLNTDDFTSKGISVYPNPANSIITINVPYGYSNSNSKLYDMTGRQVLTSTGLTLDVSSLSNGIYMLNANVDGKIYQQRVIVKK